jgi:multiple sugar transport system substrate-binding protein
MSQKHMSRRNFLRATAIGATSLAVAACAPQVVTQVPQVVTRVVVKETVVVQQTTAPAATAAPVTVKETVVVEVTPTTVPAAKGGHVVFMMAQAECTDDMVKQYNTDYASQGLSVERLDPDQTRTYAMLAAGAPLDILRCQAPQIPQLVGRKLVLDLTPYFDISKTLKMQDLAPANDYYKANSAFDIGSGKLYGMVKDWSPDMTIWVRDTMFQDAGLPVPDDTKVYAYSEVADWARKLTKKTGNKVSQKGLLIEYGWFIRFIQLFLLEKGKELYANDFSKIVIRDNPDAVEIVKWFFDLAKDLAINSPISPLVSWAGPDWENKLAAMVQYGYWFSGMVNADVKDPAVRIIPAPQWGPKHFSPTITATGSVVISKTTIPDAAWSVFEWYNSKEPALNRAQSGWGVPALRSMWKMMPTQTPLQQQVQKVVLKEMDKPTVIKFNPFFLQQEPDPGTTAFTTHMEPALRGDITFDKMLENIENDTNAAIKDGIDRLS